MADTKHIDFIEKVINKTKEKKWKWAYLDTEAELCKAMNWATSSGTSWLLQPTRNLFATHFDDEVSFVCKQKNAFIVLFVEPDSSLPTMYVIPKEYKGVVQLSPDEYGEYTTRLHNMIKKLFPHGEQFIDEFLAED